jgi:hypothetical protein
MIDLMIYEFLNLFMDLVMDKLVKLIDKIDLEDLTISRI